MSVSALAAFLTLVPLATIGAAQESSVATVELEVLVTDERGVGVAEADVVVQPGEGGGGEPKHVRTDTEGRAAFGALPAGDWQVDVRREGFMLYTGYLRLLAGRPVEVGFSSRQRTGTYWSALEVSFTSPGGGTVKSFEGERERKESRRATSASAERAKSSAEGAERAETRARKQAERGDLARVVRSTPSDDVRSTPPEDVRSTPPGDVRSTPPNDAPAAARAEPIRSPRLLQAGPCRECKTGEWAVFAEATAPPAAAGAEPACARDAAPALVRVAALLESALEERSRRFAGDLFAADGWDLRRLLPPTVAAEVNTLLGDPELVGPSCPLLAVVLPEQARFLGFRLLAGEGAVREDCAGPSESATPSAQWQALPRLQSAAGLRIVWARFRNTSPSAARAGELRVYFEPPSGWRPPN